MLKLYSQTDSPDTPGSPMAILGYIVHFPAKERDTGFLVWEDSMCCGATKLV